MDRALDQAVRRRAADRCEYCLIPQSRFRLRFPIDHIVARQHGGPTTEENLALCCGRCNRHKGPNIAGLDPVSRQLVRLFNPRLDRWTEHLRWEGPIAVGLTAIGRATVVVLNMNHPESVALRGELLAGPARRDQGLSPQ